MLKTQSQIHLNSNINKNTKYILFPIKRLLIRIIAVISNGIRHWLLDTYDMGEMKDVNHFHLFSRRESKYFDCCLLMFGIELIVLIRKEMNIF